MTRIDNQTGERQMDCRTGDAASPASRIAVPYRQVVYGEAAAGGRKHTVEAVAVDNRRRRAGAVDGDIGLDIQVAGRRVSLTTASDGERVDAGRQRNDVWAGCGVGLFNVRSQSAHSPRPPP